jgi:hypothetical protein
VAIISGFQPEDGGPTPPTRSLIKNALYKRFLDDEYKIKTSALTNTMFRYSIYSWDSERDACYIKRRDAVQEGNR